MKHSMMRRARPLLTTHTAHHGFLTLALPCADEVWGAGQGRWQEPKHRFHVLLLGLRFKIKFALLGPWGSHLVFESRAERRSWVVGLCVWVSVYNGEG